jgi:hypothetical protein
METGNDSKRSEGNPASFKIIEICFANLESPFELLQETQMDQLIAEYIEEQIVSVSQVPDLANWMTL